MLARRGAGGGPAGGLRLRCRRKAMRGRLPGPNQRRESWPQSRRAGSEGAGGPDSVDVARSHARVSGAAQHRALPGCAL